MKTLKFFLCTALVSAALMCAQAQTTEYTWAPDSSLMGTPNNLSHASSYAIPHGVAGQVLSSTATGFTWGAYAPTYFDSVTVTSATQKISVPSGYNSVTVYIAITYTNAATQYTGVDTLPKSPINGQAVEFICKDNRVSHPHIVTYPTFDVIDTFATPAVGADIKLLWGGKRWKCVR